MTTPAHLARALEIIRKYPRYYGPWWEKFLAVVIECHHKRKEAGL